MLLLLCVKRLRLLTRPRLLTQTLQDLGTSNPM